jgi:hypothetical protein
MLQLPFHGDASLGWPGYVGVEGRRRLRAVCCFTRNASTLYSSLHLVYIYTPLWYLTRLRNGATISQYSNRSPSPLHPPLFVRHAAS